MTAVLSTTGDDKYLFFLPITVWAWNQIGVRCLVFHPARLNGDSRFDLAKSYCRKDTLFASFTCQPEAEATYAQISRLFGAAIPAIPHDEILISSDIDMLVFGDYLKQTSGDIDIFGADLLEGDRQYPMCYISMSQEMWWYVMRMGTYDYQQLIEFALAEEVINRDMRGNMWARDQELAYELIELSGLAVKKYPRRNAGGFATNRIDRDDSNWRHHMGTAIDFHMFRPGYEPDNFDKIKRVLSFHYSIDGHNWMSDYHEQYIKFLS